MSHEMENQTPKLRKFVSNLFLLLPNFSSDYNKTEKCRMHADTQSMFIYNTTTTTTFNNSEQQKSTSNQTSRLD